MIKLEPDSQVREFVVEGVKKESKNGHFLTLLLKRV